MPTSSLNKLSVIEAQNAALGQAGAIVETSTTAITGKNIVAIQFIEDTIFTALTPADTTHGYGVGSYNGDTLGSVTLPAGMTIYGRWTAFTLASGKVIAYIG
tara:strand:- start:1267 stop:1572 length:306 start_codon:yes stop_codon:yes gene_type:complete